MNINKEEINKALEFYGIDDTKYLKQCEECIDFINNNKNFKNKVEVIYNILYIDKTNKISEMWDYKNLIELFNCNYHPYITSILLLSGYKMHSLNFIKYNLDKEQIDIHKKRVKEVLLNDIYKRNYTGIRISQMLWGIYFINLRLIEIGRLQYEISYKNPITMNDEICIKIHIPGGSKLKSLEIENSLKKSKILLQKYFNISNVKYYCESWLLSNQIREMVDNNSNIAYFNKLFDIIEGEDALEDILNFVYQKLECLDYNILQEDTSLRRNLNQYLLKGKRINKGIGILKKI